MRRAWLAALAATLVVIAAAAAPVRADHLAASAAAVLVDEGVADGWRTVSVDVTGSCGPAAPPGAQLSLDVDLRGRWRKDSAPPFALDPLAVESLEADSDPKPGPRASFRFKVTGGAIVTARAFASCSDDATLETAEARSDFVGALPTPLRLDEWEAFGMSYKGGLRRCAPPRRGMRVGVGYDIKWDLGPVETRSLFGYRGKLKARSLDALDLHRTGGGLRSVTYHPSVRGFYKFNHALVSGYYFTPRKPRPVRLWVTVNGLDSNVLAVRVRPRKRGC